MKGVNTALAWQLKKLHVQTDSLTVYHWILNALSGKVRLKTKASSEMLIRRRVDTIKALADEHSLVLNIELVRSECNRADAVKPGVHTRDCVCLRRNSTVANKPVHDWTAYTVTTLSRPGDSLKPPDK